MRTFGSGLLALVALWGGACGGDTAAAAADAVPAPDSAIRPAVEAPPVVAEPVPEPPAPDPELRARWTAALADVIARWEDEARRRSKGAVRPSDVDVAVHVRGFHAASEWVALRADVPHKTASNMKLVTTAAALVLLGTGTEFETVAESSAPVEDGVLWGNLVIRASGDPVCATDGDARVEDRVGELARGLAARGIRRIAGDVLLDEGTFADPAPGPEWPDARQHWQDYCALAGGFSVNGGILQARVTPRRAGGPAAVEVHPSPHGLATNYGVDSVSQNVLDVRIGATRRKATVTGRIWARRDTYLAEFAHPDPVALFGSVLSDQLERNGVRLDGEVRRERGIPSGQRLAVMRSPVDLVLEPINAASVNSVADQLFFAVGNAVAGEGTRDGGRAATARALSELGVPDTGLVQVDGSGLSRKNRASARQITALLAGVLSRDLHTARLYRDSLAVAGRSGTLERRMRGTVAEGRVYGKTGWISGVSALSGVCETLDGTELLFSILVEYPASAGGLNTACFKPMQDELLVRLVEGNP